MIITMIISYHFNAMEENLLTKDNDDDYDDDDNNDDDEDDDDDQIMGMPLTPCAHPEKVISHFNAMGENLLTLFVSSHFYRKLLQRYKPNDYCHDHQLSFQCNGGESFNERQCFSFIAFTQIQAKWLLS